MLPPEYLVEAQYFCELKGQLLAHDSWREKKAGRGPSFPCKVVMMGRFCLVGRFQLLTEGRVEKLGRTGP